MSLNKVVTATFKQIEYMSVTYFKFSCNRCDFSGTSLVTFGWFIYHYKGVFFNFDRMVGLCLDCKEIVAVEDFPTKAVFEKARAIRGEYTGKPLLKFLEKDYARYLASQKGFEALEKVMSLGRLPVCLQCGSNAIRPITIPEEATDKFKTSIGLQHPWCSGTLQVQHSGSSRIAPAELTRIYHVNGTKISEKPTPPDQFDLFT